MNQQLRELTRIYQAYLEISRNHPEDAQVWEDLDKAQADMETAWLEATPTKERSGDRSRRDRSVPD